MKIKTWTLTGLFFLIAISTLSSQSFDVYVSDAGNFNLPPWQILKFDENGENGQVFISDHLSWPQDIFFIENTNEVLVSNLNTNVISKFNATTGAFIEEFATGIAGPTRMALGPDSLLYALQWVGSGKVKRYQLDGTFVDDFTEIGVSNSIGLDWDTSSNLYVSSYNGKYVRKFGPDGEDMDKFISTNLSGPTNIWFDTNGDLLVNDWNAGQVKRFDSEGNYLGIFIPGIPNAEGVDFFPNGDIAIGVGGASAVKVYNSSGEFVRNLVAPGALNLLTPNAVVFREKTTSATTEKVEEATFVVPTAGVQFQIRLPESAGQRLSCEVFDSSGALVQQMVFMDQTTWDASNLANGIYYITSKMEGGKLARQKVVVQR